ncbi:AraC family transcriptional regulator [Streptomyces sp. ODS28]|uniref:AraC family transcriptional regulator n=1 Tax=Streptomyces sp. ODS28 TaxID=3136688 RepID=UPI0031E5B74C
MSRNGQVGAGEAVSRIPRVPFPATPGGPPGVEVLDLAGLGTVTRAPGTESGAPVRPAFHQLISVRAGTLHCSVDSTECAVGEGAWLWVRPGQIFQLAAGPVRDGKADAPEGTVVLFQPSFLDRATTGLARLDRRAWRLPLTPEGAAGEQVRRTLEMVEEQYRRLTDLPLEVHVEVVRHLLGVLVLRLSHLPGGQRNPGAGGPAFRRFQEAVERDFARRHRVEDYAHELGYSVRTLTRATRAAVGRGAKGFLDDRLVLEAKRLLLHTDLSAAAVGERLGFPEPTVFARFFRRGTGETPTAFRRRATGG